MTYTIQTQGGRQLAKTFKIGFGQKLRYADLGCDAKQFGTRKSADEYLGLLQESYPLKAANLRVVGK